MTDPTDTTEDLLRGEAAPREVPASQGSDPSNTPIDELVAELDDEDPSIERLSAIWADPDTAEESVRGSFAAAGEPVTDDN